MAFLFTSALAPAAAYGQQPPVHANAEAPGRAEIARALAAVKADPNLATERTIRTLRWKNPTTAKPSGTFAWLAWIGGLFRWFAESARALMWCAVATLVGLLVVLLARLLRRAPLPSSKKPVTAPTHVRDLDIRPETLPRDIGGAARRLWDGGEHRAALALLYRGLLSRLAHVHAIPIRDSTTEGDCLALTDASRLAPRKREYASRLVRVWQRAVYGREDVQTATVHLLCNDFASALDPASSRDPAARGGAA
jgi:hypothetical protein